MATVSKRIGNYHLKDTLGVGAYGEVKLGAHIHTGQFVAAKIIEKFHVEGDRFASKRIAREIQSLALMKNPHVIQLYEVIESPRQQYIITEYCSGGDLFEHLVANRRLSEPKACCFFNQITAGVKHMHSLGVAHRDLKPENLLLDLKQNIKIADFGFSVMFVEGDLLKTVLGTPCYSAPELLQCESYPPTCPDCWACGVILYTMVAGDLPFGTENIPLMLLRIQAADYIMPLFFSAGLRSLIKHMFSPNLEVRYSLGQVQKHPWCNIVAGATNDCRLLVMHDTRGDGTMRKVLEEQVFDFIDDDGYHNMFVATTNGSVEFMLDGKKICSVPSWRVCYDEATGLLTLGCSAQSLVPLCFHSEAKLFMERFEVIADLSEVQKHNTLEDCWVVVNGQVLDVTMFLDHLPCGELAIMRYAGKDASEEFNMIHSPDVIDKFAPVSVLCNLGDRVCRAPINFGAECS